MKNAQDIIREQIEALDRSVATFRDLDSKAKPDIEVPAVLAVTLERERRRARDLEKVREVQLQEIDQQIERSRVRILALEKQLESGAESGRALQKNTSRKTTAGTKPRARKASTPTARRKRAAPGKKD